MMLKAGRFLAAAVVFALLGEVGEARADFILDPSAVSTDMGQLNGFDVPDNVRNQSGLSVPYISLMTDFNAYTATATHNSQNTLADWFSQTGRTTGNFDFALGGTYTIESFALWNGFSGAPTSVRGFTLLAADNAGFLNASTLGSYTAGNSGPSTAIPAQVFTFAATSASFVRMEITSNYGATNVTVFGEAAFGVVTAAAVPEPSSLALMGLGVVAGLGHAWRRRRAKVVGS